MAGAQGACAPKAARVPHDLSRSRGRMELMRVAIGMLSKPQRGGEEQMDRGKCMWLAPCV